ncbi:hypothetical protein NHX12_017866 [Muraenolepis orangiensis]|uniref:Uncharacterized protein n=1 Tax=Muraenolepis orangiensis TaxID=630683 RepID=A0A9Q0IUX1_9TELE|nr:hypothetical protein NHX12_017866 [Muraenolepis orangiensis]
MGRRLGREVSAGRCLGSPFPIVWLLTMCSPMVLRAWLCTDSIWTSMRGVSCDSRVSPPVPSGPLLLADLYPGPAPPCHPGPGPDGPIPEPLAAAGGTLGPALLLGDPGPHVSPRGRLPAPPHLDSGGGGGGIDGRLKPKAEIVNAKTPETPELLIEMGPSGEFGRTVDVHAARLMSGTL